MTAMINLDTVQKEKILVQQNIQNLEQQINALSAQLQQANANLLASRGAVLAYDRLFELASQPPAAPSQDPVPTEPAPDAAAIENSK